MRATGHFQISTLNPDYGHSRIWKQICSFPVAPRPFKDRYNDYVGPAASRLFAGRLACCKRSRLRFVCPLLSAVRGAGQRRCAPSHRIPRQAALHRGAEPPRGAGPPRSPAFSAAPPGAKAKGSTFPPAAAATMEGGAPAGAPANGSAGAGGGGGGAGREWSAGPSGAKFEGDIKGRRGAAALPPFGAARCRSPPLAWLPLCCPPAPRSPPATISPACRPRRACRP